MSDRSKLFLGPLALSLATLIPAVAHADLRMEETSTSLNSTVKRWTFIKGDKRSIVSRAETSGVLYNAGGRYGAYVEIARPDQEKIFEIDPQERSYKELTADQFSKILQKGIQAPRNANEQPLRSLYQSETTTIEVVPTGKEKRIAGFQAEEVMARVVIGAQNLVSGNKFVFTFDQEIWITKDAAVMKEIRGFEDAYAEHFGSAATVSQARLLAGEWNDAFVTHLRAVNDRVRALGGFPLSCTTTVTEEAVAQAKGEKGSSRKFVVATNEVKSLSLESVADSEFDVPVGYINSDTKVAIAPKPGTPAVPANTVVAKADPPVTAKIDPPTVVAKADPPAQKPETVKPSVAAQPAVVAKNDTPPAPQPEKVATAAPAAPQPQKVAAAPAAPAKDPGTQVAAATPVKPSPAPEAVAPKPATDIVAAAARPATQPDVVKPLVKPEPGPQVAAVPVIPAAPTTVAQAAPATVKPKRTEVAKAVPVIVDGNAPQIVIPAAGVFSQAPAGVQRASSLVTVDEPELTLTPKKGGKRKDKK